MASRESEGVWPVLLLVCLAGAISFVAFGFGAVNAMAAAGSAPSAPAGDSAAVARVQDARERLGDLLAENEALADSMDDSAGRAEGRPEDPGPATGAFLDSPRARAAEQTGALAEAERRARAISDSIRQGRSIDASRLYGGEGGGGGEPQWVECVEDAVILQPQGLRVDLTDLEDGADAFQQTLRRAEYVVFLVRPGGFAAFVEGRRLAEANGVRFGFEPVDADLVLRYGGAS